MTAEHCYGTLCFVSLDAGAPKFFGFSEYLAALALMVLAWTIADVRYRFRVRTAPLPLQALTFVAIGAVGFLALLTDWWRSEQWLVPKGSLLTPSGWQAILGLVFLLTFMTWVWFAFIRPAAFNRWNGRRFVRQLYRAILKGSPSELPEIADELSRSAKALIECSWQSTELKAYHDQRVPGKETLAERRLRVRRYAYDALLLIADRKFCRQVVQSSPTLALALFEETASQRKFDVPLDTFAKNITSEAIANRDSFAYHEVEGYYTGYIGFHKPLTKALYGNFAMVDALGQVFDVDHREQQRWDADQWATFCRLVLVTFRDYIESGMGHQHSFVLFRVIHDIQAAVGGLHKINGTTSEWWNDDGVKRLNAIVDFSLEMIKILDTRKDVVYTTLRRRDEDRHRDIYDTVAELMFKAVLEAASVKAPQELCWAVQHNDVWGEFFAPFKADGPAAKIVKHKLRRLIYDEISRMGEWPNFKGSRLLGLTLNVMGLKEYRSHREREASALYKAVLSWTRKHYARIAAESPRVAADCLVDGMIYDVEGSRLIQTGMQILDNPPSRTILELDRYPG
ncbi:MULTISPECIES: hypothetical protein [Lysobacter]|uniref:hypothetical protein n=1 Tax=Lysobacter TaxID=68 RepID=UPI001F259C1E|nr:MULTISPECIES: hypothetical protein [Lysobacter]UJB19583.1 hypothetical protein L1A79_00335 [Lysobacter capsici]UJQ26691.1 hypothetical protein L2D09_14525 [Lysobacter gummosus]